MFLTMTAAPMHLAAASGNVPTIQILHEEHGASSVNVVILLVGCYAVPASAKRGFQEEVSSFAST